MKSNKTSHTPDKKTPTSDSDTTTVRSQRLSRLSRILRQQAFDFDARVQSGAKSSTSQSHLFVATAKTVRLELRPRSGVLPYGWVRFTASLRSLQALSEIGLRLCWGDGTSANSQRFIPLYPSADGYVEDLCFIAPSTQSIWIEIHCVVGLQFELCLISMQEMIRHHALLHAGLTTLRAQRVPVRMLPQKLRKVTQSLRVRGIAGTMAVLRRNSDDTSVPYTIWDQTFAAISGDDRKHIEAHIAHFERLPKFTVVLSAGTAPLALLLRSVDSIVAQLYARWQILLIVNADVDANALKTLKDRYNNEERLTILQKDNASTLTKQWHGDYILFLTGTDTLRPHAFYLFAEAINRHGAAAVLYADEDRIDAQGNVSTPIFKPDYSQKLLRSYNYIGQMACYRRVLLEKTESIPWQMDAVTHYRTLLAVIRLGQDRVLHVPTVLYAKQLAQTESITNEDALACAQVVQDDLDARDISATVDVDAYDVMHTHYALPQQTPRVSILIPTRDGLQLLRMCVDSILDKTTYKNYEIIVVDNQSRQDETHAYFQAIKQHENVQILVYDAPFNYSAINNFASKHATGEIVCLMNNDIEIISPNWIEEMLGLALQPEVGAVGAKLLYPDHTIQHGGVVLGVGGVASHANKRLPEKLPGEYHRAVVVQEFSAVTAACLMIRKDIFAQVGGLDPAFEVAYNDVDFCLRVQALGLQNVWTPYAKMVHHESATRGMDVTPEQQQRAHYETNLMSIRWGKQLAADPYYNPNLTLGFDDFRLARIPRWKKPWHGIKAQDSKST